MSIEIMHFCSASWKCHWNQHILTKDWDFTRSAFSGWRVCAPYQPQRLQAVEGDGKLGALVFHGSNREQRLLPSRC